MIFNKLAKNSNGIKIGIVLILSILIVLNFFAVKTFAQDQTNSKTYTLLAPIPCVGGDCNTLAKQSTLAQYMPGFFKLAIGLSAVVTVLMIVIGGFQYISTDAIQGKSAGKERILNAIYALVLIIGAWLILNTINPNLLHINLNMEPVTTTAPVGGTLGVPMTQDQIDASNAVRSNLANSGYGIGVNAGPCTNGQPTGCTNLNGLQASTIKGLENLAHDLGCNSSNNAQTNPCFVVSGGTEQGAHDPNGSHYNGTAVDISNNTKLLGYIGQNGGTPVQTPLGLQYTLNVDGQTVTVLEEIQQGNEPAHLHVTFAPTNNTGGAGGSY